MSFILYYLILLPLSWLPFRFLYILSDILYFVFYYLTGYRKKVITENIRRSFPDYNEEKIQDITRKFYHHLTDIVVETIKSFSISKQEIYKRMVLKNPEMLDVYYEQNKNLILAGGHYNNWEWIAVGAGLHMKYHAIALYKPLSDKFLDRKMRATRSKFGLEMISIRKTREIFNNPPAKPTAVFFAFDQSPSNPMNGIWLQFLNQDTVALRGVETYSKAYNYPVLYGSIRKIKRGYYEFGFQKITDQPQDTPEGWITQAVHQCLEKDIIQQPEYWLWSHRKWKHKRKAETI